ncbi:hypothetical protein Rhe02_47290 [Rhizocola hellebori]|uniref:Uncharacterized protein n=1 Tax=Rhizocola hellebori TaxID=1392758 RepID=A0A8J3QB81_9ACTN|nr:hypothetical protein Rhe02_47290 [Rhizocola hellebori]
MGGRHRYARGMWLRGEPERRDDDAKEAVGAEARPTEVVKPSPSWNDSTMCIQMLRDALVARGWGEGEVPEIPMAETVENDLPERPLGLGIAWWK